MSDPPASADFYLAPEYRRAALMASLAAVMLSPLSWFNFAILQQRSLLDQFFVVIIFLTMGFGWLRLRGVCLRVDKQGVHDRRWYGVWHFWSWAEFAGGTVEQGLGLWSYVNPQRPWYSRSLDLGLLPEVDQETIAQWIARIWIRPVVSPTLDEVSIHLNWPDSRRIVLSVKGILVRSRRTEEMVFWSAVRGVTVWRLTAERSGFHELKIDLEGRGLTLRQFQHQGQDCRNWTGPNAEAVAAVLQRSISADRLKIYSLCGPPRDLKELDARQQREAPQRREWEMFRRLPLLIWPLSLSCVFWAPRQNIWFALPFFSFMALAFHAIVWMRSSMYRKEELERERQRTDFLEASLSNDDSTREE